MGNADRPLGAAIIEDLGDARLQLDTAAHNLQIVIRAKSLGECLDTTITQVEQALATLRRVQEKVR